MELKKALLYSYSEGKNYEIGIDKSIDLDSKDFDWEIILLEPIEDSGQNVNTGNGVSWGWA